MVLISLISKFALAAPVEWSLPLDAPPEMDAVRDLVLGAVATIDDSNSPTLGPASVYATTHPLAACDTPSAVDRICLDLHLADTAGVYVLIARTRPRIDLHGVALAAERRFTGTTPTLVAEASAWLDGVLAEWRAEREDAIVRLTRGHLPGAVVIISPAHARAGFVSVDRGPQRPLPLTLPADGEPHELLLRLEGCAPRVLTIPLDPQRITVDCARPAGRALHVRSTVPETQVDARVDQGDWHYLGLAGPFEPLDRWLPGGTAAVTIRCRRADYIGWIAPVALPPVGPARFDCNPAPRSAVLTLRVDAPEAQVRVDGQPVAVRPLSPEGDLSPTAPTVEVLDADRAYALPVLPAGTHQLVVEAPGREAWGRPVTFGRRPLLPLAVKLRAADAPLPPPRPEELWAGEVQLWALRLDAAVRGSRTFDGAYGVDSAQRLEVGRWVAEGWQVTAGAWLEQDLDGSTRGWGLAAGGQWWPLPSLRLGLGPIFRQIGHAYDTVGEVDGQVYAIELTASWHPRSWFHLALAGDVGAVERRQQYWRYEVERVETQFEGVAGVGLRVGVDWSPGSDPRMMVQRGQ